MRRAAQIAADFYLRGKATGGSKLWKYIRELR